MPDKDLDSIQDLITQVTEGAAEWGSRPVWFRGEPDTATRLVPSLYRKGPNPNENQLLQTFRARAPGYASGLTPPQEEYAQWLYLARHANLPTRLLDWTESALHALYFALREEFPVVWMLDPLRLNDLSVPDSPPSRELPLPWVQTKGNIGNKNMRGAWGNDHPGVDLPVAIPPTYVHPRMSAQRSCFTVHGKNKDSMWVQVPPEKKILKRYFINPEKKESLLNDLRLLGIERATLFPDLDGLAEEICERFAPELAQRRTGDPPAP